MKTSRCRYRSSLAGFISALFLAVSADAATLTVTSTADAGGSCLGASCTLRQAITTAAAGDTIDFSLPANSTITLTNGELLINKNLTINGPGANQLSVQRSAASGTPQFRIFEIASNINATISGLTISNGRAFPSSGGGISNNGTLTITSSTISGNSASDGGGIHSLSTTGTVTITNSTISGNTASGGGGISNSSGTVTVTNSTISGNSAQFGGGIYTDGGTVTITNSTISGNSLFSAAVGAGGGIYRVSGTVNARNTIIALNTATTGPDVSGTLTSQGFNLIGNTSGTLIIGTTTGNQLNVDPLLGPLQNNGGPTFTHALLSGSTAIERGHSSGSNTDQRGFARPVDDPIIANATGGDGSDIGAYEVQADLLPGCNTVNLIVNNNNDSGAGSLRAVIANVCAGSTIAFAPNVTGAINLTSGELLINKTLTINGPGANLLSVQRSASAGNFRIFNIAGNFNVTISGLTIANGNTPGSNGGGIYNNGGTLTVSNSTLSGNSAGSGAGGGGIFNNDGTLTVTNSTLSGNSASFGGGGINNFRGTVTITNSTISGNTINGGHGGGIYNSGDSTTGTVTVANSTISGNTASESSLGIGLGGGIHNGGGTVTVTNSTISGNTAQFRGGGINSGSGTLRARNTIIALNTSANGPDVFGALTSQDFNLIGNNAGTTIAFAQFSDQIGVTPAQLNLGPLQNNGGPTFTHALLSGSTAIDKGHSSGSSTDQRGFRRPVDDPAIPNATGGDGSDIGAYEYTSQTLQSDCLFNWAEENFPSFFAPAGAISNALAPYYYRYYPQTNAYLGTSAADNHVYYLGPLSNNALFDVGALLPLLSTAGCQ